MINSCAKYGLTKEKIFDFRCLATMINSCARPPFIRSSIPIYSFYQSLSHILKSFQTSLPCGRPWAGLEWSYCSGGAWVGFEWSYLFKWAWIGWKLYRKNLHKWERFINFALYKRLIFIRRLLDIRAMYLIRNRKQTIYTPCLHLMR